MRILIYSMNYAPELTGTGKYSGEMGEWLLGRGMDVQVIASPPYYPEWQVRPDYSSWKYKKEKLDGVLIWRCPVWVPLKPSGVKRVLHLMSFALSSLPIALSMAFWRPNIVIVVEPPIACLPGALLASWIGRSKTWLHIQDFEIDAGFDLGLVRSPRVRRLISRIERWLMARVDRVSAISLNMLKRLKEKGVADGVLFPNWVDLENIYPDDGENRFRRELNILPTQVVFLYSGNMGEKQGLEIILDAARRLGDQKNIVFVMCGQGAASSRLKDMAAGLGNLHWLPLQPFEYLNELLNMADVHLLPQRADAADLVMPSKLTGMLASGRPVIATGNPGTEVAKVLDNIGFVVGAGDTEGFIDAIKGLSGNKKERDRMGHAGRFYAKQNLGKEVILTRFGEALKDCVENTV